MFGLERRDYITYGQFTDTLCTGDRDYVNRAVEAAFYKGVPYNLDYCVIWPDGSEHIIHAEGEVTYGPGREPVQMFGTVQDITERKRAEEALRESEGRMRLAQQVAHTGTFEWNIQTGVNTWTPELEAMYGLPKGGFPGTQPAWEQLVYFEDRAEAVRQVSEAIEKGEFTGEWRVVWPDGTVHWLYGRGWVFKDESGKPLKLLGINIDITERKRIEEVLSRQAGLIDLSPDGIIVRKPDGEITFWSKGAETLYGWTRDEALGQNTHTLFHTQFPQPLEDIVRQLSNTEHWSGELVHTTKDGRQVVVQSRWLAQFDGQGNISEILESNVDITERKRAEDELKEAKMRAELYLDLVGHDISNMHQIMEGQLELAEEIMAEEGMLEGDEKELIDTPLKTLMQSNKLIENVRKLQMMEAGEYKSEPVDIGGLLGDVVAMYSDIPGNDVVIDYTPVHDYYVEANPLLKDVFANLVDNAVKHSNGSVHIGIKVDRVAEDGRAYYSVAVEDNGPGIPAAKKDGIFHRFKRSQTKARGTGLGLYIVKTLVESYHGRVWVEDRVPGEHTKGSRFVVYLPVLEVEHGE